MDWEVWGTFSVGDHLRRRAFVADALLYDRLVIPVPPTDDEPEHKRWVDMGWRPQRQRRMVDLIGRNRVIEVPWTESHRHEWETRYRTASGTQRGQWRSEIAARAKDDVSNVVAAQEDVRRRGGRPDEVDSVAHFVSRTYLADWANYERDLSMFAGLPPIEISAVAAYGSYRSFQDDMGVRAGARRPDEATLAMFGWEFFVPNDPALSDDDLLEQALELGTQDEIIRYRKAVHQWWRRVRLSGATAGEAIGDMEELIGDYRNAIRRTRLVTATKYAFAVVAAGAGVAAALAFPPAGAVSAFASLGSFIAGRTTEQTPERLEAAALFHDARKRFGWRSE